MNSFVQELGPKMPTADTVGILATSSDGEILPNDATLLTQESLIQQPVEQIVQHNEPTYSVSNSVVVPKKKVSFRSEVNNIPPVVATTKPHSDVAPLTTTPTASIFDGFKISMTTLYLLLILVVLGIYIYYQQSRKQLF